jgi:hypothetical protein
MCNTAAWVEHEICDGGIAKVIDPCGDQNLYFVLFKVAEIGVESRNVNSEYMKKH